MKNIGSLVRQAVLDGVLIGAMSAAAGAEPVRGADSRPLGERQTECLSRIMGPGTFGYLLALAVDPFDSDNVIIGSDMGIGYRSADGGKTWKMIGESGVGRNPAHRGAMRVAFHPRKRGVVYFGGCHGLFRSNDGGQKWTLVNGGEPRYITNAIAFDPDEDETVFFACGYGQRTQGWWRYAMGVYRLGGAAEWLPLPPGVEDPGKVSQRRIVVDSGKAYLLGTQGLSVWDKAGKKWRDLNRNLSDIGDIASPAKGVLLAVKSGGKKDGGGLYRSADGGETWSLVSRDFHPSQKFAKYAALSLSPSNREVMYVAVASGLYKSVDGGIDWRRLDDDSGIGWYTISEKGDSFSFASPKSTTNISPAEKNFWGLNTLSVAADNPDLLYMIDGHGIVKSADGGGTFHPLFLKYGKKVQSVPYPGIEQDTPNPWCFTKVDPDAQLIDPNQMAFDPFDPERIALAVHDVGLQISDDYGKSWRAAHVGIGGADKSQMTSVAFDPEVKGRIYAGPDRKHLPFLSWRYYVSEDTGFTWRSVEIPWLVERKGARGRTNRTAVMKIYPRSDGLWLGTSDGVVIHRRDGSWRVIEDLKYLFIESIAFLSDGKTIFVSSRFSEKGGESGLYRSQDGGRTFVRLNPKQFGQIASFSVSRDGKVIYVAAQPFHQTVIVKPFRLYRSDDGGDTWSGPLQPDKRVHALAIDPYNPQRLLLATGAWDVTRESAGVWESPDGGVTVTPIDPAQPVQASPRVNHGFWFDPRRNDRFFLSTSLGLYEYRKRACPPSSSRSCPRPRRASGTPRHSD